MAEETQPAKPRRLRQPETMREKAEKTAVKTQQPSRRRAFWHGFTAPVRTISRPLGKILKRLGGFKPLRIIGLILVPRYFRNSWKELRQVAWPTRREARQLTLAVILFATAFGALIALVDFGLDKVFKQVLLK